MREHHIHFMELIGNIVNVVDLCLDGCRLLLEGLQRTKSILTDSA